MKDVLSLLPRVIGPLERYCCGCNLQPEAAYVTTPVIGIGTAPIGNPLDSSQVLARTLAFDRAEADSANITQTNMIAVSSFNGPQGLLLGYDLLRQACNRHPLIEDQNVYSAEPLFAATRALYGTVKEKRFPIAAGSHLVCAYKTLFVNGPCLAYGALAVGIAQDRGQDADLFMEDLGILPGAESEEERTEQERQVLMRLIDAVKKIGENLGVRYHPIFVGLRARQVVTGELACVLTAAPYIQLAKNAVPNGCLNTLASMSLPEWEAAINANILNP